MTDCINGSDKSHRRPRAPGAQSRRPFWGAFAALYDGCSSALLGDIGGDVQAFASKRVPDYLANAFFKDDAWPLSCWDVALTLRLLRWTREDLLEDLERCRADELRPAFAGKSWRSLAAILGHVADAENWTLSHLGHDLSPSALLE